MLQANNLSILIGTLTGDPEVLPTRRGDRLKLSMRIAVKHPHLPGKTSFFTVVKWDDSAAIMRQVAPLQKGTRVYILGWWQSRDLANGSVATEMVADTIVPLENLRTGEANNDYHSE